MDGPVDTAADDATAFARFVADRRPELLRTALLLTGDRSSAEELVQRALTRARRRSGDPGTTALRTLVAGAASRWSRMVHTEQVIDALPDPFARPAPDGPEPERPDLATALRELPAPTRAVVVLRWYEGLSDARIAELLHCPVATVAAEAAAGLEQLRPALAPSPYERAPAAVPAEDRLSARLAVLADAAGHWRLDTGQAVADVRARRSTARRRLTAWAGAVLVLVGVAVPLARWAPDPPPATAPAVAAAPHPSALAPPTVPVLTGPTRGSLAGDDGFLAALRSVGWNGLEPPPPGEREVVLATDTPTGRVALVVGTVLEDFRGVWLTGPVGAAAADLVPHLPQRLGRDRPLALLVGGPGDATLVVVAAPGDQIAVSERLMTGPRGTVGRSYDPVDAVDGVAVVPARTTRYGSAVSVRVTRQGREVYRAGADWLGTGETPPTPRPDLRTLRPGPGTPDPRVVGQALVDLAVPLGVEPTALQAELLWGAELQLQRGTGTVAVVLARSPGGALVVSTWADGGASAVPCGTQTPPGSTDVATLTVARVCDVTLPGLGQTDDGRWLVVTAPPAAASAELLDVTGRVLRPLDLVDGSAVVALPGGAQTVRTLDAGGQPIREIPVAPPPSAPFGDYGPGPAR